MNVNTHLQMYLIEVSSMNKQYLKKVGSELQEYLLFRRRGKKVDVKKGKGYKYNRSQEKCKAKQQAIED